MGGFVVTDDDILNVKFINLWQNAKDIQELDIPTANDRFNYNVSNKLLDKSQLDLIIPTPNKIDFFEGQMDLKTKYSINIDESLNLNFDFAKSLMSGVAKIVSNNEEADIKISFIENLTKESYELNIDNNSISIEDIQLINDKSEIISKIKFEINTQKSLISEFVILESKTNIILPVSYTHLTLPTN